MDFLGASIELVFNDDVECWEGVDNPGADTANGLIQLSEALEYHKGQLCPPKQPPVPVTELDPTTGQEAPVHKDPILVRKARLDNCGRHSIFYLDPHSMKMRRKRFKCELWRDQECEECYIDHVVEIRDQIRSAWKAHKDLYYVRIGHDKANRLLRHHYRSEYIRLPVNEQPPTGEEFVIDFLVMRAKSLRDVPGAKPLTYDHVFGNEGLTIDYYAIANTPDPLRRSGNLGKECITAASKERTIKVPHISVDLTKTPKKAFKEAFTEVCQKGHSPYTRTYDAVQDALNMNVAIFVKALRASGGSIISITAKNVKCDLNRIDWSTYIRSNRQVTPELASEIDLMVGAIHCPETVETPLCT